MAMKKDDKISMGLSGTNFPAVVKKNPLYEGCRFLAKGCDGYRKTIRKCALFRLRAYKFNNSCGKIVLSPLHEN